MDIQFSDNTKARIINEKQDNRYVRNECNFCRAQEDIYAFLEKQLQNEDTE
jgi:polyphosphate kinase